MNKDKICELKGRCHVVFPKVTIMRESGDVFNLHYHIGDKELALIIVRGPDELGNVLRTIKAIEDGYRKHNIDTILIEPEKVR